MIAPCPERSRTGHSPATPACHAIASASAEALAKAGLPLLLPLTLLGTGRQHAGNGTSDRARDLRHDAFLGTALFRSRRLRLGFGFWFSRRSFLCHHRLCHAFAIQIPLILPPLARESFRSRHSSLALVPSLHWTLDVLPSAFRLPPSACRAIPSSFAGPCP